MRIGYLTFGRDDFGFGLALCIDELRQRLPDAEIIRATPTTARLFDVLLFSVFWWEHVWCLAAWLRAAGIEKKQPGRPRLVVGGFNTFNPVPLLAYADAVVCGDGELAIVDAVLGQDHPSIYDGTRQVVWATAPTVKPFAHVTNGIARIEAARGCKARCRFCQVAHLKPYREVDADRAMDLIDRLKVKRVSLFAPEPTQHTRDGELTERCRRRGITRVDSDVRLDRLRLREEAVPRVGIEGLSERLRRMVRKGYSDQQILEAVRQAIADGRKGLFMYLILDLPTEEDADWSAFRDLLIRIGELPGATGFLLKPSPSVFMPGPFTPMEGEGIHWQADCAGRWSKFFGRGEEREWAALMAERSRVFAPASRVLSMIATRGGPEFFDVERLLAHNKVVGIGSDGRPHCSDLSRLVTCLRRWGGPERWCAPLSLLERPWRKALRLEHERADG